MPTRSSQHAPIRRWTGLTVSLGLLILAACYHGHGLEPVDDNEAGSGITGRVTFVGEWPDSTREVRVAALRHYPTGITDSLALLNFMMDAFLTGDMVFGDTLPRFVDQADYQLDLQPGDYAWVVAAWFPDIDGYLAGVKELGAYTGTTLETDPPQTVTVKSGRTTAAVDIRADFAHVKNNKPFFKALLEAGQ